MGGGDGGTSKDIVLIFKCVWLESIPSAGGFAGEELRCSEAMIKNPAIREGVEMRAGRGLPAGLVQALGWLTGSRG